MAHFPRPLCLVAISAVALCVLAIPIASSSAATSVEVSTHPQTVGMSEPEEGLQTDVDRAGDFLAQAVDAAKWSDYGNEVLDQSAKTVTIYSVAAPPPTIKDAIALVDPSIAVILKKSRYTAVELRAEAKRIATSWKGKGRFQVEGVGPQSDANALWIEPGDPQVVIDGGLREQFVAAISSPVSTVVREPRGAKPASLRNDPYPAFWGSGLIQSTTTLACGTGYVIFTGSAPNRLYGATTANHCGADAYSGRGANNPTGAYIGRTHARDDSTDIQWLTGGASYGRAAWRGAWNSSTGYEVENAVNPPDGATICQSGALSGQICGTASDGYGYELGWGPGFYMKKGTACAVRAGDSGSAVYSILANNRVTVRGTVNVRIGSVVGGCQGNPYLNVSSNQNSTMFSVYVAYGAGSFAAGVATVYDSETLNE